jgi:hypothetical protein
VQNICVVLLNLGLHDPLEIVVLRLEFLVLRGEGVEGERG